jgi:hypothetical protein
MTRFLAEHQVNDCNEKIQIEVADAPGSGNASHRYDITGFDTASNPSAESSDGYKSNFSRCILLFQNGPIGEVGTNGITHEALLAIVADRLRSFQSGPYACRENRIALTQIEEAMHWLSHRTSARLRRGVEGTHAV